MTSIVTRQFLIGTWRTQMADLIIDAEFRDLIPPLDEKERAQLEENILRDGIQDPLKVWNGILIDGHNRYEIAQAHGLEFKTVEMQFDSRDDIIIWIIQNQLGRRNLIPPVRIKLALLAESVITQHAKVRQLSTLKQNTVEDKCPQRAEDQPTPQEKNKIDRQNKTNYQLAQMAGVSDKTVQRYKKILQDAPAEVVAQVDSGEISINQAFKDIKRAEKETRQEERRVENAAKVEELATPLDAKGLFQTIVIDPPWDWGDEGDVNQFGRAKPDYSTMPFDEIKNLPIDRIADENCHLYLWVTNRSLPKAFALIEAWGFRYITCITWIKPSFGMGNYFRGSTEQILFAVKGSQPLKRHDVGTHFAAPRGDGHSSKPDEFYRLVESCSFAPFIDIFGRKERDGWSVWGENG